MVKIITMLQKLCTFAQLS